MTAFLTMAGAASAQTGVDPVGRSGATAREELRLPPAELEPPPRPVFELPPLPPEPEERLDTAQKLFVADVSIEGNEALDDATLAAIARPFTGREVTLEELFRLKDLLTLAYVEAGYVNSGAVLPEQDVSDGIVRIEIVEGALETVEIDGTERLDSDFLERRVRLGAGPPLDVEDLQERLQLLLLDPSIARLDARLGPGSRPGQARLELDVEEGKRFAVELRASNDQSPSIGAYHGEVVASGRDFFGRGDEVIVQAGLTEGLKEAGAEVRVPLTPRGLTLHAGAQYSDSDLIDDEVKPLDIQSKSKSFTVGLAMPIIETLDDKVVLDLFFTRERNETFLLGDPFSFSPGSDDGRTDLSLLRFSQTWQNRGRNRAFSLGSTFTLGLDAFGATDNERDPDGEFFGWLLQAEAAQRLFTDTDQLVLRGEVQLVDDPLLSSEQFAAGGIDSVRGYRTNELVRDMGWKASLEYRYPILDLLTATRDYGSLELVPFVDAAGAFDHDGSPRDLKDDELLGAGLGLRYLLPPRLTAELYWGYPILDRDGSSEDPLQDAGVVFRVRFLAY